MRRGLGAALLGVVVMATVCYAAVAPGGKGINASNNAVNSQVMVRIDNAEKDQYWLSAKSTIDKALSDILAQHEDEQKTGVAVNKLMHGDPDKKEVALTFDDGPHPKFTPRLLALLKKYNVKATFFVVGEMAEKYPDLVRAEEAAGNSIGNHTYHHVSLPKIPEGYVATEIKACDNVLNKITHKKIRLFRPPGGDYNKQIAEVSEALGHTIVLWTDDPGDYASPGVKTIEERLMDRASNGGIILVHDGIDQTLQALPSVIEKLKKQGYQFVTIDEMLRDKQAKQR